MTAIYFVEILSQSGDIISQHKCHALPIRIGRNYENDIILDDPHTAPAHASITENENGQLLLCDNNSINGIRLNNQRKQEFTIHGDDIFQLGHTQIRIRTNAYEVAPELADTVNHRWEGWPRALIALAVIIWIAFSNSWIGDVAENKSSVYLTDICTWLGIATIWASIWALANRVFASNAHFSRHLFILACGLFTLDIWGYLTQLFSFGFSLVFFTRYGNHIEIAMLGLIAFFHLRQIAPRRIKRLALICSSLVVLGSSLLLLKNYQNTHQLADEFYMHEMLPPSLRFSQYHSVSEFNEKITQLQKDIDADREQTLKTKALEKK